MDSYVLKTVFGCLETIISKFAEYGVYAAFAFAAYRLLFPRSSLSSLLLTALKPDTIQGKSKQQQMIFDAILVSAAAIGVSFMLSTLWSAGLYLYSPGLPEDSLYTVASCANVAVPSFESLYDALTEGVHNILLIVIVAGLYAKYCRSKWFYFLFIFVQALISASDNRYWQDYVLNVAHGVASGTMWWFLVTKFAKRNFLAYFLFSMDSMLLRRMNAIARHGMAILNFEFVFMAVLLLTPLIYYLYLRAQSKNSEPPQLQNEQL
jgi:hypothetical protein